MKVRFARPTLSKHMYDQMQIFDISIWYHTRKLLEPENALIHQSCSSQVTRWYRPPELILLQAEYTAAVDVRAGLCGCRELAFTQAWSYGHRHILESCLAGVVHRLHFRGDAHVSRQILLPRPSLSRSESACRLTHSLTSLRTTLALVFADGLCVYSGRTSYPLSRPERVGSMDAAVEFRKEDHQLNQIFRVSATKYCLPSQFVSFRCTCA